MKIIGDLELWTRKPAFCNVCGDWKQIGVFNYYSGTHCFINDLWICADCLKTMAEKLIRNGEGIKNG